MCSIFRQKTAYELRISDWSSDVCSSDLFFVTTIVSATFIATIGLDLWPVIVGLILGGVLAAPFAAFATRRLPDQPLMILVAIVIMLLGLRELIRVLPGG